MGANGIEKNQQVFDLSIYVLSKVGTQGFDDDGRLKRTGTVWTASAHIITAVIGSGVLSLAWATAQLGWIAGPAVMILFSFVGYYTSALLAACYRPDDPVNGKRNLSYMEAVRSNLRGFKVEICGFLQYLNLYGVAIGYTISASISMMAIKRSNCFYASGGKNQCRMNSNPYMIAFGMVEIILSQIPNFDQIWWLFIVSTVMSFTYSTIGLSLGIAKIAETGKLRGSLTGISVGSTQKIWRSFQALGHTQSSTIRVKDNEESIFDKCCSLLNLLCGCVGYAAFGDKSPANLLTGFGFYNPFWLLEIANAAIVIHLFREYQVYCQPLFAFVEKKAADKFPHSDFFTKNIQIPISGFRPYKLNLFRLVWRTTFVILTTLISMLLHFFNDMVRLLGALGFWPLTVCFPVDMYISQKKIPKWSTRWLCLQILSVACLIITVAAAAGSVAGIVLDLNSYKPFSTDQY